MADTSELAPFDARCHGCGNAHIVKVPRSLGLEEGDTIKHAHLSGVDSCGEYVEHTLESKLIGLMNMPNSPYEPPDDE